MSGITAVKQGIVLPHLVSLSGVNINPGIYGNYDLTGLDRYQSLVGFINGTNGGGALKALVHETGLADYEFARVSFGYGRTVPFQIPIFSPKMRIAIENTSTVTLSYSGKIFGSYKPVDLKNIGLKRVFMTSHTPLGAGASTGMVNEPIGQYEYLRLLAHADTAGTLYITNFTDPGYAINSRVIAVAAGETKIIEEPLVGGVIGIEYVNGGVAQTEFDFEAALCSR